MDSAILRSSSVNKYAKMAASRVATILLRLNEVASCSQIGRWTKTFRNAALADLANAPKVDDRSTVCKTTDLTGRRWTLGQRTVRDLMCLPLRLLASHGRVTGPCSNKSKRNVREYSPTFILMISSRNLGECLFTGRRSSFSKQTRVRPNHD